MVSTRSHPRQFPPPDITGSPSKSSSSPTKRQSRLQSAEASDTEPLALTTRSRARSVSAWSHTPSTLTFAWLFISLPLVLWDCGYVLLRPHSMPGGKWHSPVWTPYELYTTIDYLYGWPAWQRGDGFTGAQGAMNIVETLIYVAYLYIAFVFGQPEPRKKGAKVPLGLLGRRKIVGREAGLAVLFGFTALIMTLSKTVLYMLHNYYTGWESVGHNDWTTLITLWIIPNGAWIVLPTYLSYVFGSEILSGLEQAAGLPQKKIQ